MTDDSKATPRPWRYDGEAIWSGDFVVIDYDDIMGNADERASNAALIVTAVNAHDALDAARQAAREQCAAWHDTAALKSDWQAQITLSSELRGRHLANARLHRYSAEQIRALSDKEAT